MESGEDTWAPTGALFYTGDAFPQWRGDLLFTGLAGESLYRLRIGADGTVVGPPEALYTGRFGRLRDVVQAPDGTLYLLTSNRARGGATRDDDRVIHLVP